VKWVFEQSKYYGLEVLIGNKKRGGRKFRPPWIIETQHQTTKRI